MSRHAARGAGRSAADWADKAVGLMRRGAGRSVRLLGRVVPEGIKRRLYDATVVRKLAAKAIGFAQPADGPVELLTSAGARVTMDLTFPEDVFLWTATHEQDVTATVLEGLRPGDVVYDVGAHQGYMALLAASRGARAIAFEPEPTAHGKLQRNVALNPSFSVRVERIALGAAPGFTTIDSSRSDGTSQTGMGGAEVVLQTLDRYVAASSDGPPAVIKIDVEGAEGEVLLGAEETLRRHHPLVICEVHSDAAAASVCGILWRHRYRLTLLPGEAEVSPGTPIVVPASGAAPHVVARPPAAEGP